MSHYTELLKSQLAEYQSNCYKHEPIDFLEMLVNCYLASDPVDNGWIREKLLSLAPIFASLSLQSSDALHYLICELCTAYQRAAFLDGLRAGVTLSTQT